MAELVAALRDSIALSIGGVTATYPFDVDSSRALYDALFGPVAGDLARLDHLVFEPDGALLQLPINLLTADQAGVDAYHARVDGRRRRVRLPRHRLARPRQGDQHRAVAGELPRRAPRAAVDAPGAPISGSARTQPLGAVTQASLVRGAAAMRPTPAATLPLASWNRPIPADELVARQPGVRRRRART